jgi:hypothetical protein
MVLALASFAVAPQRPVNLVSSRPVSANSGHSQTVRRTGQVDPKHAFPVGSRYGRKAPESCRSRYWQMRQELPSIYLFPFGVEACFL